MRWPYPGIFGVHTDIAFGAKQGHPKMDVSGRKAFGVTAHTHVHRQGDSR